MHFYVSRAFDDLPKTVLTNGLRRRHGSQSCGSRAQCAVRSTGLYEKTQPFAYVTTDRVVVLYGPRAGNSTHTSHSTHTFLRRVHSTRCGGAETYRWIRVWREESRLKKKKNVHTRIAVRTFRYKWTHALCA